MNTTSTVFHCRKEIVAGSKVLAKKFNDIWYSGVVTDVQKPENTENPSQVSGKQFILCIAQKISYVWKIVLELCVEQKDKVVFGQKFKLCIEQKNKLYLENSLYYVSNGKISCVQKIIYIIY